MVAPSGLLCYTITQENVDAGTLYFQYEANSNNNQSVPNFDLTFYHDLSPDMTIDGGDLDESQFGSYTAPLVDGTPTLTGPSSVFRYEWTIGPLEQTDAETDGAQRPY